MKKLLLLALVAGGLTYGAPSASACHMTRPWDPQCLMHSTANNQSSDTGGRGARRGDSVAAVVRSGCHFSANSQETVTGGQDVYTGSAEGYVLVDDQGTHTLRCYITVDGSEQTSSPTGSGTVSVTTAGQVTYVAWEGTAVDLCTEIDGATVECAAATTTQLPPPSVIELLESLYAPVESFEAAIVDPIGCPILASMAPGIPGVVDITADGDVYLQGEVFRDCPPYGG